MEVQKKITEELSKKRIAKTYEALIEYPVEPGVYFARTYAEAPEIDGAFFIHSEKQLIMGEYVNAEVTGVNEYDLIGEVK